MNRNRAIAILLLCIACAFVAIRVSIGNKDKRGGTTTGNETLKSTEKPVAVDFAGLKKLAGRDSEGAIMRMDRATCIAAIQSGAFNGKSDGLLEKLLSRLA